MTDNAGPMSDPLIVMTDEAGIDFITGNVVDYHATDGVFIPIKTALIMCLMDSCA